MGNYADTTHLDHGVLHVLLPSKTHTIIGGDNNKMIRLKLVIFVCLMIVVSISATVLALTDSGFSFKYVSDVSVTNGTLTTTYTILEVFPFSEFKLAFEIILACAGVTCVYFIAEWSLDYRKNWTDRNNPATYYEESTPDREKEGE